MKPHVSAITLGVRDIERTKMFYGEGLAWPLLWERAGHSVGFSLGDGSSVLDLFQWNALADDAGVAPNGSGFPGFAFSYIVSSEGPRERVDEVLAEAQRGEGRSCGRDKPLSGGAISATSQIRTGTCGRS
jgi:catechol 2,3-dioxygenase-like lactoylglutathione lyase family enzyme